MPGTPPQITDDADATAHRVVASLPSQLGRWMFDWLSTVTETTVLGLVGLTILIGGWYTFRYVRPGLQWDFTANVAAVEWLKELEEAASSANVEAKLLSLFMDRKESALLRKKEDEARIKALRDTIERQLERIESVRYLTSIGVLVSVIGFVGWYVQLQRPQDTLLKIQVQAAIDSANARHAK